MQTGILTEIMNSLVKKKEKPRDYLGASSIGKDCERSIWYQYNNYLSNPHAAHQLRTFNIGHRLESMILDCLEEAGLTLIRSDLELLSFKDDEVPQLQGHVDAIWIKDNGQKSIIEVKTARDSSFKVFQNKGINSWYPSYYSQIQCYMGLSQIENAYLIAINKDTSEIHDEQIAFNAAHYKNIKEKASRIINTKEPPKRINENACYFMCRMCDYRGICHE